MNCYRHQDRTAVGVCKSCGKATCPECCEETVPGVACSPHCIEMLHQDAQLKQRLRHNFGVGTNPPMPATVSMYAFFALILLAVAAFVSMTRPGIDYLTFSLSAVFFVMAWVSFRRYKASCTVT